MNRSWIIAWAVLLVGGCVLESDHERLAQTKKRQDVELERLRNELARQDRDDSRQAADELDLRKRIAQLNEQVAALREANRHLTDRAESAERANQAGEQRRKALVADHQKQLARAKQTAAESLAQRDAQIEALKKRVNQLEEVLAGIRNRGRVPSTNAAK